MNKKVLKLKATLKNSPGIIVAVDTQNKIIFKNYAFDQLPSASIPHINMAGSIPSPSQQVLISACQKVINQGESLSLEMGAPTNTHSNSDRWFHCQIEPIFDENKNQIAAIVHCVDNTSHKENENQLKRNQALLSDAHGLAHLGIWEWDLMNSTLDWTEELYKIFGLSPKEFTPTYEKYLQRVHPDDRYRICSEISKAMDEQISFSHEERILRPDKSIRYLRTWGNPIVNNNNKCVKLIGVCLDITDEKIKNEKLQEEVIRRKEAQKSLQGQRQILEMIAQNAPLKDILETLTLAMGHQSNGMICSILLLDKTGKKLLHGAAPELPSAYNEIIHNQAIGPQAGSCGTAAYRNEIVIVNDTYTDPLWVDYRDLAKKFELRSCWSVPITSGRGQVLGIFAMYSKELRTSTDFEMSLIKEARHLTGIAIEHANYRESLERIISLLHATLESTADGIIAMDKSWKISTFNQKFLDLWQIPESIMNSREGHQAFIHVLNQLKNPDDFSNKIKELYQNAHTEGRDLLKLKDSRIFEWYSRSQQHSLDEKSDRVWSFRDITRHYRNKETLQRLADASKFFTEARLDLLAIMDTAARWVADIVRDGCIISVLSKDDSNTQVIKFHHVNPRALKLIQQLSNEYGTDFSIAESPTGAEKELIFGQSIFETEVTREMAQSRIHETFWPFLERYPIQSWIFVPLKVGGQIIGNLAVIRNKPEPSYTPDDQIFLQDVADRAALAIDNAHLFAEAKKNIELREDFMAIASHELKTPFTPLKMQLQLLKRLIESTEIILKDPKIKRLFDLIEKSAFQIEKLTRLIDDLLDVSRINSRGIILNLEEVNLTELVSEVYQLFQQQLLEKKCEIHLNLETGVIGLWDRLRIEQIITNLLTNAIKYGAGNPIVITVFVNDGKAIFSIQDHGIGIKEEDRKRIFERFERAVSIKHYSGLGMGLYITHQIVEALGGRIWIDGHFGAGSIFTVELPLKQVK